MLSLLVERDHVFDKWSIFQLVLSNKLSDLRDEHPSSGNFFALRQPCVIPWRGSTWIEQSA